ncbi:MAG TPA: carboxypeptidase-like regulatory domain-containing protein [Frateuria sp.]|uniref:carboxypeptidase-like regulatory domain-containing protein n=1 Tax=Frateuria sp. TaxID=2211372 RepID=UPI002D7FE5BF|nr:carboxypeptidase-like regulatory domain-containing protein [Frateuria sp.]HET6805921.1 carboxypeptidase-like regulatory domain-containing protein [Frateuria sp.]
MKNLRSNRPGSRSGLSVRGIAMAAALVAFGAAGSVAHAQSTDGKVFGNAPVGSTVLAKSTTTGTRREVRVDKKGRYAIRALPVGVYTVTLSQNGQPVARHLNVPVIVGRGIQVNFDSQLAVASSR